MRTCERFHCLPSQLRREDMSFVRMLRMVSEAKPEAE